MQEMGKQTKMAAPLNRTAIFSIQYFNLKLKFIPEKFG